MNRRARSQRSFAIIGPGNWGSSLARALVAAGAPVREVIVRPARGAGSGYARWLRALPLTTFDRAQLDADVLWLCVPDAAIAKVTERLVRRVVARGRRLDGQIVIHSSGALSSEILAPAARLGAAVGSVHPVMTFPGRTPVPLQDVPFGVEADAATRRILNGIVRRIRGRPFAVEAAGKALYHRSGCSPRPCW